MSAPTRTWHHLLKPADPLLLNAGAVGELVVAKLRLLMTALLLVVPVMNFLIDPHAREHYFSIGITTCAMLVALLVYLIIKRDLYQPWVGFVSTIFDVSFVSSILAVFVILGEPHTAVNSKVVFEAYFIAIAATSLRYDVRFCLLAGVIAMLEYGGIVGYAALHWDLNGSAFAPFENGMFSWPTQVSRLILLGVATALSTVVVVRAQALRRLSMMDRMTGVFNRGYFDERLGAELSRARRHEQPLALVMLDVDHFKAFNDRHGHAAGDAGLRALSTLIRHSLRRSDLVARYGGEEFVLVMPVTTAEQVVDKLESLRQAIAGTPIRLPRQQASAQLTISAGIAVFPTDGVTADELIDQADARLFQAKEAGRNRIVGPPHVMAGARPSP
ncbi:MAG: GGDEF domain-containing protein [Gemmatimonadales bacterium]|nr:GGDEF domain-containing protein [Gemmatimonadales bacterium]